MRSEITRPSPRTWIAACACTRASASGLTPSIRSGSGGDGLASPRRVVMSMSCSARRWRDVRPATSAKSSSRRHWARHSSVQLQKSQCPTGSGFVGTG